jgi:hypothetical protein
VSVMAHHEFNRPRAVPDMIGYLDV